MNLHFSFLHKFSGVAFLFKALIEWPSGFLYKSSFSVLRLVPPNFNFKLIVGRSLELLYEFLRDDCL